jgi:hypothetical protein
VPDQARNLAIMHLLNCTEAGDFCLAKDFVSTNAAPLLRRPYCLIHGEKLDMRLLSMTCKRVLAGARLGIKRSNSVEKKLVKMD